MRLDDLPIEERIDDTPRFIAGFGEIMQIYLIRSPSNFLIRTHALSVIVVCKSDRGVNLDEFTFSEAAPVLLSVQEVQWSSRT